MIAGVVLVLFGLHALDGRSLIGVAALLAGAALIYYRREQGLARAIADRADPARRPSPQMHAARFATFALASALEVLAVICLLGALEDRWTFDVWSVAGAAIYAAGLAYAAWETRRFEQRLTDGGLAPAFLRGASKLAAGAGLAFLATLAFALVRGVWKAGPGGILESMVALGLAPLLMGLAGLCASVVWKSRLPDQTGRRVALALAIATAGLGAMMAMAAFFGAFPAARGAPPIYAHLLLYHCAVAAIGVHMLRRARGFRHLALAMAGLPVMQSGIALIVGVIGQAADPDALVRDWSVLVLFFPLYLLVALGFATMLLAGGGFLVWAALGGETAFRPGLRPPFGRSAA